MVQHYALKPKASKCPIPVENTLFESSSPCSHVHNTAWLQGQELSKKVLSAGMGRKEALHLSS